MSAENQSYGVKSVSSVETTVGIGLQAAFWFYMAYQHYSSLASGSTESWFAYGSTLVIGLLLTAVVLVTVWQRRRPAYALMLNEDKIVLRKRELTGDRIKRIYVSGEKNPSIGIKPRGWWFVPNDYAFQFSGESDSKLQELIHWAKANKVQIVNRNGARWM